MPQLPLRLCRKAGCSNLVAKGYCEKHTINQDQAIKARFKSLDNKKTKEQKAFYSSAAWTRVSKEHRIKEPLCRRCKAQGLIVSVALVHHNPSLQSLLNNNLNPFNHEYLESLCMPCHQKDLSDRRIS